MTTKLLELGNGYYTTTEGFSEIISHNKIPQIVISVPHDQALWSTAYADKFKRRSAKKPRDWRVADLARNIAIGLPRVAIVRNLFPRSFVDMNRSKVDTEEPAYEDQRLEAVYDNYHHLLDGFLHRAVQEYGKENVLLLDLHGFAKQPQYAPAQGFDVILGTCHKRSLFYGSPDIALAKYLGKEGFEVFVPDVETAVKGVEDFFPGRHIVQSFSQRYEINAIQLEINKKYRSKRALRENGSKKLEEAVTRWLGTFRWGDEH